ncbi:MAG: magnesium transporter, partial [Firmicutes bacterium]|nr:magnesium transporter [Bacillota bacterium]
LAKYIEDINSVDAAELLSDMEIKEMLVIFRLMTKEAAADVFSYMEPDVCEKLIGAMTDKELEEVLDELFIDDTVDLIEEMPANVVNRLLRVADEETRNEINTILKYPKDSAGSIMTTEYVKLNEGSTVGEAIKRIRSVGVDKETIYTCYVTENRKLKGVVTVKDLLMNDDDTPIADIMEKNVISASTKDDKEDVARMFDKYDFMAIPVVDSDGMLVGIVTFDDAIDVIQDETTEDMSIMAAVSPSDDSYFDTSIFTHAKNRIIWLLVLMLSATITGVMITKYEDAFKVMPILVSFIPMLMDTGGNCGSQSSTLVIRGIALDEIQFKDTFKVMFKEFRIALIVSVILALVNGIRIYIMYGDIMLAVVIAASLIGTIIIAKMIGCLLPLGAKKCGLDPAIMAAPLITTIVDNCSILIYFKTASIMLGL